MVCTIKVCAVIVSVTVKDPVIVVLPDIESPDPLYTIAAEAVAAFAVPFDKRTLP